jgi:hypothetical protein
MKTLTDIKQEYPQYADVPDAQLADALYNKYYSSIPRADFDAKIGIQKPSAGLLDRLKTQDYSILPGELQGIDEPAVREAKGAMTSGIVAPPIAGLGAIVSPIVKAMTVPPPEALTQQDVPIIPSEGKPFEEILQGLTYEPKTPLGQTVARDTGELLDILFKPVKMAGEGWGMIGATPLTPPPEALTRQDVEAAPVPFLEPTLASMGEASAIFSAGGIGKIPGRLYRSVTDSAWYRGMTIPERGLVVSSLEDMIGKGYSEGELLRKWNNPQWREEALARRMKGEQVAPGEPIVSGEVYPEEIRMPEGVENKAPLPEPVQKPPQPTEAFLRDALERMSQELRASGEGTVRKEQPPSAKKAEAPLEPVSTSAQAPIEKVEKSVIMPPVTKKPGTANIPPETTPKAVGGMAEDTIVLPRKEYIPNTSPEYIEYSKKIQKIWDEYKKATEQYAKPGAREVAYAQSREEGIKFDKEYDKYVQKREEDIRTLGEEIPSQVVKLHHDQYDLRGIKNYDFKNENDLQKVLKVISSLDGHIGLRGIYKKDIGKNKIKPSVAWDDNSPTSHKLGGTSILYAGKTSDFTTIEDVRQLLAKDVSQYGDSGIKAIVFSKESLNPHEIYSDIGEAVFPNAKVLGYINAPTSKQLQKPPTPPPLAPEIVQPGATSGAVGGEEVVPRMKGERVGKESREIGEINKKTSTGNQAIKKTSGGTYKKPSISTDEGLLNTPNPWEMTKAEFDTNPLKELLVPDEIVNRLKRGGKEMGVGATTEAGASLASPKGFIPRSVFESGEVHKAIIKQALSEGKPVPPEVLKDYPDLAKPKKEVAPKKEKKKPLIKDERGSTGDLSASETVKALRKLTDNITKAMPHLEALGKRVYQEGYRTAKDWARQMKTRLGDMWDSFKKHLSDVWEKTKQIMKSERGSMGDMLKSAAKDTKDVFSDINKTTDEYLGAISTRLANIDPSLKNTLRKFEYRRGMKVSDRVNTVLSFIEKVSKMPKDDRAAFDIARKNGDPVELRRLVTKYNLGKEYHDLRVMLKDMYTDATGVGYDVGYRANYHPRVLKDQKGFLEYFYQIEDWPVIENAIREKEGQLQRYLTDDEKAKLINSMLRGYPSGQIKLSTPGQLKERQFTTLWPELNKYYMDSDGALLQYISDVTDAVEARKLFGKGPKGGKVGNLNDTIGGYVLDLVRQGKLKPKDERVLRDILDARFNEVGTRGVFGLYKNISYIDTMGSPISAITQIGDLAWALYKNGLWQTAKAGGKAIIRQSQFKKEDIGIARVAEEFADTSKAAKAVTKVFKWIGLEMIDNIGKEGLINSTYKAAQKKVLTPKGEAELRKELQPIFEGETDQLIQDIRGGNITENVKLYLFNTLADFQPIALSEMPQKYLTGGNGRIFYMLKTFTLKQFDTYRREAFQKIAKPGTRIQGIKNLMWLMGTFVAANVTADIIKDLLLGRKIDMEDKAVDNLLRLVGISKFVTWKAREEGVGSALVRQIAPPFKAADAISKDIDKAIQGRPTGEIIQSFPFLGKLYYWWFGKGAEKTKKKEKQMKNKPKSDLKKKLERALR